MQSMGNRRIAAGILTGEFKMPWHFLAEMPLHSRASGAGGLNSESNSIGWRLYRKVRTYFQTHLI
jgi:hypothetical protein